MSRVWSCNEWDQLEEVIIGNPLNARYPTPDRSTQVAEFPDRSLAEIPRGPFPQQVIEETEEDLNEFARILEGLGVVVRRPQTWPHDAGFSRRPPSQPQPERHAGTGLRHRRLVGAWFLCAVCGQPAAPELQLAMLPRRQ